MFSILITAVLFLTSIRRHNQIPCIFLFISMYYGHKYCIFIAGIFGLLVVVLLVVFMILSQRNFGEGLITKG